MQQLRASLRRLCVHARACGHMHCVNTPHSAPPLRCRPSTVCRSAQQLCTNESISRRPPSRFSITALEQGCQRCGRDVYTKMYADEAARVAEWMEGARARGHGLSLECVAVQQLQRPGTPMC